MAIVDQIEWCETPLVAPTRGTLVEQEIRRQLGLSLTSIPYLAPVPWVAWSFATKIQPVAHIPSRLADLITLVVSMENSCRHCYGATRSILRLTGYSQNRISELEEDFFHAKLDERSKAVLDFSRKCARADPRPDARDLEVLERVGLSRVAVAEVAYVATNTCYSNRLATLLAIPPDGIEDQDNSLLTRLFRPLVAIGFRKFLNRARKRNIRKYASAPGNPQGVPFGGRLVNALQGSPTADVLQSILNGCWHSPHTATRTKALAFAIIARTLNCPVCTAEASQLLKSEGLLQEDIDHLQTYLSSDALNGFESSFIHFARDTVNYQVPDIQFVARRFLTGMGKEEIIELCGLVALANWVARLSIILEQSETA
ncbi:AhpD family alkylhydroperoxidase [Lewinella marina]|uniref:Carboxymuconolactone decarboxylase-like domain-containing protein n=1 Tax=Neolewinella marina TaxID=438751 RepID=A0A2G0CEA4_9BACT|nr:hypothetical protein [Neolewinella marina]NJB87376.1 AhpD family alkylhydroperoxidase [Neolewinella marina]PHK98311.1 hypothetical protein CGL56_11455 [Neolewinella marina]